MWVFLCVSFVFSFCLYRLQNCGLIIEIYHIILCSVNQHIILEGRFLLASAMITAYHLRWGNSRLCIYRIFLSVHKTDHLSIHAYFLPVNYTMQQAAQVFFLKVLTGGFSSNFAPKIFLARTYVLCYSMSVKPIKGRWTWILLKRNNEKQNKKYAPMKLKEHDKLIFFGKVLYLGKRWFNGLWLLKISFPL